MNEFSWITQTRSIRIVQSNWRKEFLHVIGISMQRLQLHPTLKSKSSIIRNSNVKGKAVKSICKSKHGFPFEKNVALLNETLIYLWNAHLYGMKRQIAKSEHSNANEHKGRKVNMERKSMENIDWFTAFAFAVHNAPRSMSLAMGIVDVFMHLSATDLKINRVVDSGYMLFRLDEHQFPHISISIHSQFERTIFSVFFLQISTDLIECVILTEFAIIRISGFTWNRLSISFAILTKSETKTIEAQYNTNTGSCGLIRWYCFGDRNLTHTDNDNVERVSLNRLLQSRSVVAPFETLRRERINCLGATSARIKNWIFSLRLTNF